jgi:hypothetical protein
MALLLWLCFAGIVLALLSLVAPALAARRLLKHAERTARAHVFADIERFHEVSARFARADDALAKLAARVRAAAASAQASLAELRFL